MKKVLSLVFALSLAAVQALAQQAPLSNKDVLDLIKAGLTAETVVAKVRSSATSFDTSPAALKELKDGGVPDQVLLAMVDASAPKAPAADAAPPADGKATLYFYRVKQFTGSALEPTVSCDGVELARMDNGRYFGVRLDPGEHTCNMGDKQTGFVIDAKPGETFYAKVSIEAGFWKGRGRLTLMQAGQGEFELKKVKPLGVSKVKDRTRVTIYEGSSEARPQPQAEAQQQPAAGAQN